MTTTTPNMNLILPDVSVTAGPQWATLLNAAYALIDSHDHTTGNGVKITPAGLSISSDLTFAQNNATNLRTVRLFPNNSFTPISSDKTCLYALGGELFYIDAAGTSVQITLNGAVDISGSITALSLKDSSFFIQYFGDVTRQFRFNASAIPTATTRILSIPDSGANDTFVTQAASQVLTNKTLTAPIISSINTGTVTFALPSVDGTSGQVLQTNGSAALSFATAATTVGTVAANDSNVTFTNANNRVQISTPTAARTYTLPTTGIAAGDQWTFYNQATSWANVITLQSSGGNTVCIIPPQGIIRLAAVVATPTTAANWVVLERQSQWIAFTPTFTGLGTVTNINAFYKLVGDTVRYRFNFTTGTPTAVNPTVTVPTSINMTKLPSVINNMSGNGAGATANAAQYVTVVTLAAPTLLTFTLQSAGQGGLTPDVANGLFGAGSSFSFVGEYPI